MQERINKSDYWSNILFNNIVCSQKVDITLTHNMFDLQMNTKSPSYLNRMLSLQNHHQNFGFKNYSIEKSFDKQRRKSENSNRIQSQFIGKPK